MAKALSIRLPWIALIVLKHKDIEVRTWNTDYRGPLLLHCSKAIAVEALKVFPMDLTKYQTGGIVAKAELVDVIDFDKATWHANAKRHLALEVRKFKEGLHGYVLRNVKPIPFIEYPGQNRIFDAYLEGGRYELEEK